MNDTPDYESRTPEPKANTIAVVGLVLGILSLCGGLLSIPGIICSGIGMAKAGSLGGSGRGKAIVGLVLSILGLVIIGPLAIIVGLAIPAFQKVREAKARQLDRNYYSQVGIALLNYESDYAKYPLTASTNNSIELNKRLSWRVAILPHLEQASLYYNFDLTQPWDSSTNRPMSSTVIRTYADIETPGDPDTRIRIFYDNGAMFDTRYPTSPINIPDGTSNTIMAVEGGEKVTWSRFQEYKFDPNADLPPLGKPKNSHFFALMGDGSVRSVKKSINPQLVKNAIHASDNTPAMLD